MTKEIRFSEQSWSHEEREVRLSSAATEQLVEAGIRHAEGLTAQLAKPDWAPRRAHIEQARNSILKLAEMLKGLSHPAQAVSEPVAWRIKTPTGYVRDIWDNREEAEREADGYWRGTIEPLYAAQPPAAPVDTSARSDGKTIGEFYGDPGERCSADTTSAPEYDDKCEYYPYFEMLWKWFEERRGKEDMRANAIDGLSVDDFKQMLDEHEANLIPDVPQEVSKL